MQIIDFAAVCKAEARDDAEHADIVVPGVNPKAAYTLPCGKTLHFLDEDVGYALPFYLISYSKPVQHHVPAVGEPFSTDSV